MTLNLLLSILLAANPVQSLNQARQAYAGSLGNLLRADLKERIASEAFETRLASSCSAEQMAFRNASVAADVALGTSRATAEQNANFEITDMLDNTKQRYRDYLETNTEPR